MSRIKFILIVLFILFRFQLFSQIYFGPKDLIYNSADRNFNFDLNLAEKNARTYTKKIFISIYITDTSKIKAYNCLPFYNFELFEIKFNNYFGDSTMIFINLKKDNNNFKTISSLRSTLFLYCSDTSIQSLIKENLAFLSLGDLYNNKGVKFYKIENVGDQEMFCWKLRQIYAFFERHKEILKGENTQVKEDTLDKGCVVNINSLSLKNLSIAGSNILYKNSLASNKSYPIFGVDVQFIKKNFRAGVGLFHLKFNLNNSIENSFYSVDWSNNNLNGNNSKNIYYNNVKEEIIFSNYNLALPFSYLINLNKQKSLFFDINTRLFYSLPFIMKSKLISGEFSYRGKIEGINDELTNIPSLGLIENDQSLVGKESCIKMLGGGFNIGVNVGYNYHSLIAKLGFAYYNMNYWNLEYEANSYLSKNINDYNSSFFGVKKISSNSAAFLLGIGYIIN